MWTALVLWLLVSLGVPLPQQPAVQNGQVEARSDVSIERVVAEAAASVDPVWIAWRVPMVPGDRDLCSTWSNGEVVSRGLVLEDLPRDAAQPGFQAPRGPVQLEAGASLVVLLRMAGGEVERVRVVAGDCPIDAGGRRVVWLSAITPATSVQYLDALTAPPALPADTHRRVASTAVMAIALHEDAAADRVLDRILSQPVAPDGDTSLRSAAASWTARARGRRGFDRIVALLASERDAAFRRTLASTLAATREPETLSSLSTLARSDADEQVRAEAVFGLARLTPSSDLAQVRTLLANDASAVVKRRGVRGLAQRRSDDTIALLIDLARSSDQVIRTEAVRAISRSSDPAAIAYLTSVLTR